MVTTMSLRARELGRRARRMRAGERGGEASAPGRARRRRASSRGRRRRGATAIGRPITPRPTKPSEGGRDVMAFRVYEEAGRRNGPAGRAVNAGKHCMTGARGTIHFSPASTAVPGDDHMKALRIFAPLAAALRARRRRARRVGADRAHDVELGAADALADARRARRSGPRRSRRRPTAASSSRCCPSTRRRLPAPSTRCATASSTSRSSPRATRRRAIRCR